MRIAVVSLKGGVGKTFVATNLATYLYRFHRKKILLIDLAGKASNSILLTKKEIPKTNGRLFLNIIPTPYFHIRVTSSIHPYEKDLELLERIYNYIILDVPPSLQKIREVVEIADLILLITNADFFALYTNYLLFRLLPKDKTKIVVNKYMKELDLDVIEAIFKKPVSVVIPFSKDAIEAEKRLMPVVVFKPHSKITRAFDDLAYLITGKKLAMSWLEKLRALLAL